MEVGLFGNESGRQHDLHNRRYCNRGGQKDQMGPEQQAWDSRRISRSHTANGSAKDDLPDFLGSKALSGPPLSNLGSQFIFNSAYEPEGQRCLKRS